MDNTDGWIAWVFLEGNHDFQNHITESINGIVAFHKAIKNVPKPEFIENQDNPYTRANLYAWGEKQRYVDPQVKELVDSLYMIRKPMEELSNQLIHGDLNPDNILLAPNLLPAIIDIAPYWHPPEYALAVYAYWIGAWRDKPKLLQHFSQVKEFDQMLVRAGIRMLLIMSESHEIDELHKYKRATEIIHEFIS